MLRTLVEARGSVEAVTLVVEAGAELGDPGDGPAGAGAGAGAESRSPLAVAAAQGRADVCELLLRRYATPELRPAAPSCVALMVRARTQLIETSVQAKSASKEPRTALQSLPGRSQRVRAEFI